MEEFFCDGLEAFPNQTLYLLLGDGAVGNKNGAEPTMLGIGRLHIEGSPKGRFRNQASRKQILTQGYPR